MDFVYAFANFLVLSHLLILHSAQQLNCPQSFSCGNHSSISFPFANSTYPGCGLGTIYCEEQVRKIQLGPESKYYDLMKNTVGKDEITIHDPELERFIINETCQGFNSFNIPNSPYISFTMLSTITLFKCNKIPQLDEQTEEFFRGNHSYRSCPDFNLYYSYPNILNSSPLGSLPPNCLKFNMPVLPPDKNTNSTNLFSLLSADFSLKYYVSRRCYDCHSRGGLCQHDQKNRFLCANTKQGSGKRLVIKVAIASSAGIVTLMVVLAFFIRKKLLMIFWKKKTENYRNVEAFLKSHGTLAPKRYNYSEVKKMTKTFKVKLGQGGYGSVYKGNLQNGCLVAVKILNESKGSDGEEFINEVASISRTSHVNVVNLLGFCFEGSKRALIYEFLPNGSLEKFIYEGKALTERKLSWETLFKISVGIARGLEYLHRGCNTRILHFDIKPHNILLDKEFCPKISDFGLAKLCPRKESVVSMLVARGTVGYIAPEVFCRNFGGVSHKSDVYSYGMMVMEMVGGRKNIDVGVERTSEIYFPHWIYERVTRDEVEPGLWGIENYEDRESVRKMVVVGLWCIQTIPSDRPPMSRVVEMLEGSVESLQIPPKPFLSSPSRSSVDSSSMVLPLGSVLVI